MAKLDAHAGIDWTACELIEQIPGKPERTSPGENNTPPHSRSISPAVQSRAESISSSNLLERF